MKQFIHLFTPLDGSMMPFEMNGDFIIVSEVLNTGLCTHIITHVCEVKNGMIYYNAKLGDIKHTHFLDLSRLTTKEHCQKIWQEGYDEGFNDGNKNANTKE